MPESGPARWAALFGDLEGQLAAQELAVRDGEVAELTRAEHATITLTDRLRAVVGVQVGLELHDGEALAGTLQTVAESWLLIEGRGAAGLVEHLVPTGAVSSVTGLTRQAVPSTSRLDTLGMGGILRELQRDRARVVVRIPGGQCVGRLARVGKDHLDIEETDRRPVRVRTVPFAALLRVSRA